MKSLVYNILLMMVLTIVAFEILKWVGVESLDAYSGTILLVGIYMSLIFPLLLIALSMLIYVAILAIRDGSRQFWMPFSLALGSLSMGAVVTPIIAFISYYGFAIWYDYLGYKGIEQLRLLTLIIFVTQSVVFHTCRAMGMNSVARFILVPMICWGLSYGSMYILENTTNLLPGCIRDLEGEWTCIE